MKTQIKTLLGSTALVSLALLTASETYAQSNGTGGANGVRQTRGLRLRDMVDPSTCKWQNGETLLASNAELRDRLARLRAVNWYFSLALEREIRTMDFCATDAELKRPAVSSTHSVLVYEAPDAEVIGVRIYKAKEVYYQRGRYNELGPGEQALFYIHEAMHSFIPLDIVDRYSKLFTIVRTIGELTGEAGLESRSFETAVRKAGVMLPQSSMLLSDEKFLAYLFDSYEGRKKRILSGEVTVEEILRPRSYTYLNLLPAQDQTMIAYARDHLADEAFREFCLLNDEPVLARLRQQSYRDFNIDLYCVTAPGMIERILDRPGVLDTGAVAATIDHFYEGLSRATAWVHKNRVVVSPEVDWISGNPAPKPRFRYALEVRPPFQANDQDEAQITLVQYTRILVAAAKVKSSERWLAFVQQGNGFFQAFYFARLGRVFDQLRSPIADEAPAAKQNLLAVYKAAVDGIVIRLRNEDLDEHADALVEWVNRSGLGYKANEE